MVYNLECVNHKDYSKILTFKNCIKEGDNYFLDITTIDELNDLVLIFGPIIIEECVTRFTIVIGSSETPY